MICPICKTYNNQDVEFCVQCSSDLHTHHLLSELNEKIQVNNDLTKLKQELPTKTSRLGTIFHIVPSILLLGCTLFGIFIGIRFLTFLDRVESHHSSVANKWSETGFEQLQQMNSTIKQELELIIEQRRENQNLQAKLQELTTQIDKTKVEPIPLPSIQGGAQ